MAEIWRSRLQVSNSKLLEQKNNVPSPCRTKSVYNYKWFCGLDVSNWFRTCNFTNRSLNRTTKFNAKSTTNQKEQRQFKQRDKFACGCAASAQTSASTPEQASADKDRLSLAEVVALPYIRKVQVSLNMSPLDAYRQQLLTGDTVTGDTDSNSLFWRGQLTWI